MVRLADEALARRGRMIDAIERIGRGEIASEAMPFSLAADAFALKPLITTIGSNARVRPCRLLKIATIGP